MLDNVKAAVLGAFIGDALALGAHWIYDQGRIARDIGRVETYRSPPADTYHPTKRAGQFTHYGDQTLVLLRSLAARKFFDLDDFGRRWRELFQSYDGYVDGATKGTLANIEFGDGPESWGSGSNDLAGAARLAPLVAVQDDLDGLIADARRQAKMTHNRTEVLDSAEFFARALWSVLGGTRPAAALEQAARADYAQPLRAWTEAGLAAAGQDTVQAVARFGQSCHAPDAFPSVVQIVARHEDDPAEGLIQNVMAGGDSAARGLLAGALLFGQAGLEAIPAPWLDGLDKREEITGLLESIG